MIFLSFLHFFGGDILFYSLFWLFDTVMWIILGYTALEVLCFVVTAYAS